MIIIAGLPRCGTSLVARTYKELGFDPGGEWFAASDSGLEAPESVVVNQTIARELGLNRHIRSLSPLVQRAAQRLPEAVRGRLEDRLAFPARSRMRWERVEALGRAHRSELRRIEQSYRVLKDPRISATLPVWVAAGVAIDHMVVCVRNLDAIVESAERAEFFRPRTREHAKNGLAFVLGVCLSTLLSNRIPHSIVRYPDFLREPNGLYASLPFPDDVSRATFLETFERIAVPDRAEDRR